MGKGTKRLLLAGTGLLLAIQLIPYGHGPGNAEVVGEPEWDRPQTRELFDRACKDCHSYETQWPWYGSIAPGSWLMRWDIDEGRSHFNVSEWGRPENGGDAAAKMVRNGEMPLWYYLPAHPEARLSEKEKADLIAGLIATFGDEEAEGSSGGHHADGESHHH